MDLPIFNLMAYSVRTTNGDRNVLTFRSGVGSVFARIAAPSGTELYRRGDMPPQLKVPKRDKPHEYDLLTANEAIDHARAGTGGLMLVEIQS